MTATITLGSAAPPNDIRRHYAVEVALRAQFGDGFRLQAAQRLLPTLANF